MNLKNIFAATTALAIATTAVPALADVYISTNKSTFDSARKGIQSFSFPFQSDYSLGKSYTLDKVTFASDGMSALNDSYTQKYAGAPVLANISGDFSVTYNGPVLGLTLIAKDAEKLSYTVNGLSESISLAALTPTFVGFDTGSAAKGVNLVFDATCSSTIGVLGFQTAVPEAATWAMMIVGLGVVGGSLRRRRTVATSVRFA